MPDRLTTMIEVPKDLRDLLIQLEKRGFKAWVVGGSLRDRLLGREVSDWDLATNARPEQVIKAFARVIPTGLAHGTVTVRFRGQSYELTTLRTERGYSDGRRPDEVHFVDTIEEDLARRDFTINAMAFDPGEQQLVDPYGGLDDLKRKTIRTVGQAEARFGEDGLRVLRAARFVATLEFDLDPATEAAIPGALEIFSKVSKERIRDEIIKTMKAKQPSLAFEVMRRTGMLDYVCPKLSDQFGCEQNKWHAFDVWHHTMACLDACPVERALTRPEHYAEHALVGRDHSKDIGLRMAALLHDIGKPATREHSLKTNDFTFYNHEKIGARMAEKWLKEHRFSNAQTSFIVRLIEHHLVCYSADWTDAAVRRFIKRVGTDLLDDLVALARADALAKGRAVDEELALLDELQARIASIQEQNHAISAKDLRVNGSDLMKELNLAPSKQLGLLIEALLEEVLEDPARNDYDHLIKRAKELLEHGFH
ncbi:MAG: HD domain-containing protein [Myxococcales bacterium]|nr:MAG: HD domain-containing protein [Myxococcales bacterium]